MGYSDFLKRVLFSTRERLTSSDLNKVQNRFSESMRILTAASLGVPATSAISMADHAWLPCVAPTGFLGSGFSVSPDAGAAPRGIKVAAGVGYAANGPATATDVDSDIGADWYQSSALGAPLVLSTDATFNVPASPASGHSRIDIIEVKASYLATESATVGIFNTISEVFDATSRNKSFSWDLANRTGTASPGASTAPISYVTGVDATGGITSATEPSATSGYIKIARINLDGAVSTITQDLIADLRPGLRPNGMLHVAGDIFIPAAAGDIGTGTANNFEVPPGITVKVAIPNATPPATGKSYKARVYILGGSFGSNSPRGAFVGVPMATSGDSGSLTPRIAKVECQGRGLVTAAIQSILAGTDTNYDLLCSTQTFAIGQPYIAFDVWAQHPASSAISGTERVSFTFTLSPQ